MNLRLKITGFCFMNVFFGFTQANVFDCSNYTLGTSQQAIENANGQYFSSCINLTNSNDYNFNGNDNNTITAAQRIHIEEGVVESTGPQKKFYSGDFTTNGKMHLEIQPQTPSFEVFAMNYPDLNAIEKYDKFELGIVLPQDLQQRVNDFVYNNGVNNTELNPYVDWETQVYCTFSHSSGSWYQDVQGFFFQDFERNLNTDSWDLKPGQENATDYPSFRVRFAPPLEGDWLAQVHIKINGVETHTSPFFGFNVFDTGRSGFVKVHANKKNLERDGEIIFPVGACLPYAGLHSSHYEFNGGLDREKKVSDYTTYNDEITQFANVGGKFTRIFFDAYCGTLEWNELGNYTEGMKYVNEMDKTFEIFKNRGLLVEFTLMMHDPIAIQTDFDKYNWDFGTHNYLDNSHTESPYCYASIPGINNPIDMFMHTEALKYIKQRYRYMISRYGYSTNVYMYSLLSEPWHINQDFTDNFKQAIEDYWITNPNQTDYNAVKDALEDEFSIYVPYDDTNSQQGAIARAAIENFHSVVGGFIKNDLQRGGINLLCSIGHMPTNDDLTSPDCSGVNDVSWGLNAIDIIGISTYDKSPKYMYKSETNNYSNTFKNLHDQFNKPALFVETDHGNKSYDCTNNKQAIMVMNRLGTSGCAGFNIWRTFGSYAPELDELVRVSDFMNTDFITSTFDAGNGDWKHQASLWKIKVSNDDGAKEKPELRELECIVSANKTKGFGTLYNRQFNVHNYADANFLTSSVETTNCNLGPSDPATNGLVGYLFSEGWEQKSIEWNKKKKLKVLNLKNNTDYRIKYYDYDTYNLRSSKVQNSSWSGKLKIKHPKLAWEAQDDFKPIYTITIEEVASNKSVNVNTQTTSLLNEETTLYPNPNDGSFVLRHSSFISNYVVLDMTGRTFITKTLVPQTFKRLNLDLDLNPGIYYIRINDMKSIKFVCYE